VWPQPTEIKSNKLVSRPNALAIRIVEVMGMPSPEAITHWLHRLEAGDPDGARVLWDHYFQRLVELARGKLRDTPRQVADEEDVALSAFASFCRGVEKGRFADLPGREGLWPLLVRITACKVTDHARRERARKRGGDAGPATTEADLAQVVGSEPSPAFAAQVADECRRLVAALPEEPLRAVALWRMEGWTVEEIAGRLNCTPVTVKRKLARIRSLWRAESET
jgi:DNA-directed RNA polymerase specialized sigma24 family protein